jgi:hypothetical protein
MPVSTPSSSYIQILDSRIVADLCAGKFYVDLTPSTFFSGGAAGMKGAKVKILDQNFRVIKDYPTGYDFGTSGDIATHVLEFAVPKVGGVYKFGTYTISVSVTDGDNKVFDLSKTVKLSFPDLKDASKNYRTAKATIVAIPKDDRVHIVVDPPQNYGNAAPSTYAADVIVEFPLSSLEPGIIQDTLDFYVNLYDGIYKVSGNVCVTYVLPNSVSIRLSYVVKGEKDVLYTLDFMCVLDKLAELNSEISCDRTCHKERERLSSVAMEALFLLKSAEIAASVGQDPSAYLHKLNYLLGIDEADPGCQNRTSILHASDGGITDGVCVTTNLSDGSVTVTYPSPSSSCSETIRLSFDKTLLGKYDLDTNYFDDGQIISGVPVVKVGLASRTNDVIHRLIDEKSGDTVAYKKIVPTFNGQSVPADGVMVRSKSGEFFKRIGRVSADWWGFGVDKTASQNATALQAAINVISFLGGGEINIGQGTYLTNPFIVKRRVVLVGEGNGHASVYFTNSTNNVGTVLLVNGVSAGDCVSFEVNSSFSGIRNISVFNNNNVAIRSVVNITGVLYPTLTNVEISSKFHAPAGQKTYGLLCKGNLVPNGSGALWDTLYANFVNVNVITNDVVGVSVGLGLIGVAVASRPNAIRCIGGHFQGYSLSLEIDATASNSRPQGIAFLGTTFESYFNSEQQLIFVPGSVGFNAFTDGIDRYAVVWIRVAQANQVIFTGCYFENGGVPFSSLNDGTHGAHPAFPMIHVTPDANQVDLQNGNTLVAGVYDQGYATRHPNKISFLDQYGASFIQAGGGEAGTNSSQVEIGSMGDIAARFRGSKVLINTNHDTGEQLQINGVVRVDGAVKYVSAPNVTSASRFLTLDAGDQYIKYSDTHNGINSINDITIIKVGGAKIQIGNQNNSIQLGCYPDPLPGLGIYGVLVVEGNELARFEPDKFTVNEEMEVLHALKIETPDPAINDNTAVTSEWVKFQKFIPQMSKVSRDAMTPPDSGFMVYVTDGSGYYSYYNGTAWRKFTDTAD